MENGPLSKEPQELDLAIIEKLQVDARRPFGGIALELGLPESTVRKRVRRLESAGVVRFTGFADPLRLGFQYWCWISLAVELKALERVAQAVAQYDELFFVGVTTGEHNLFVAGVFRSNEDLLNFLTVEVAKMPGVTQTSTSNVLRIVKRTGHLFADSEPPIDVMPAIAGTDDDEVSPLDLCIIGVLQTDGRISFAQVASQLGVAVSTVHSRVARLRKLGILQFEAFADPLRLGYQSWSLLKFSVESGQAQSVASKLAKFRQLFFVGLTTGERDIFTAGVFRSNDDLLRFLTEQIAPVAGVRTTATTNVLRLIKRQLMCPLASTPTAPSKTSI